MALPKIIVVVGPTASGKTALGLELAKKFDGEIINADSRQVYTGMNIGTAKIARGPGKEYIAEGVRHHLIDVVQPDDEFTLAHYKKMAVVAIDDIIKRGKLPIIVGGTGLYVWSIIDNLDIPAVAPDTVLRAKLEKLNLPELIKLLKEADPLSAGNIDLKNPRRVLRALEVALSTDESFITKRKMLPPLYDVLQLGIIVERDELVKRVNDRVDRQIRDGLVDEVSGLSKKYAWNLPAMSGIGYRQIGLFLKGEMSLADAVEMIKRDTRRYAKRQITWFKRDKRIHWVKNFNDAETELKSFIE